MKPLPFILRRVSFLFLQNLAFVGGVSIKEERDIKNVLHRSVPAEELLCEDGDAQVIYIQLP